MTGNDSLKREGSGQQGKAASQREVAKEAEAEKARAKAKAGADGADGADGRTRMGSTLPANDTIPLITARRSGGSR